MSIWENIFSIVCVIVGVLIFIFAAGELLLRLLFAVLGLLIINFGLRARGQQSLHWMAIRFWSSRHNL